MSAMIPTLVNGRFVPMDKLEAHRRGLLHKAVSVFVLCGGDVLLQRRAMAKYHTPGLWANTCCTHPYPGEDTEVCAHRRLREELGIGGLTLHHRERVTYRADVGSGLIEHERVDIFVADVPERIAVEPNPSEVMAVEWVDLAVLSRRVREHASDYSPWLRIYLKGHADRIFAGAHRVAANPEPDGLDLPAFLAS